MSKDRTRDDIRLLGEETKSLRTYTEAVEDRARTFVQQNSERISILERNIRALLEHLGLEYVQLTKFGKGVIEKSTGDK